MKYLLKYFFCGFILCSIGMNSLKVEAQNEVTTNNEMGSFVKKTCNELQYLPDVSYQTLVQPRVDFIDVSSHNGVISVDQYKKMKNLGVKGVVVKLTEGTKYRNPLAPQQINNAKKAGLIVSTFHFSWFENQREAIDQANYYADYAEELGQSPNSVMVNDAETPPMINADPTKVSVYFKDQLEKRGFKNVVHYSSDSWFNNNWMEYKVLGKENCWVAEWPSHPSNNNLLHTETAAWQWSSKGSFDFVPNVKFDFSVDYLGRFVK